MRILIFRIVGGLPILKKPAWPERAIVMAKRFAAALLGLACLTGCRMCASPYDDCYPVIDNNYPGAPAGPSMDDEYGATTAPPSRNANQPQYAGPRLAH